MIICVQWCLYSHCLQGRRDDCLCTVVSLLSLFVGQERCLFVYSGVFTAIVCRVGEMFVCVQWCLYRHCLQGRRDVCLCTVVSLPPLSVGQERCLLVYSGVFTLIVCRVGEMFVCVQWCLYSHCLQGRRDVCLCTVVSLLSLFVGQEKCLFVYSGVFTAIVCRVGEMFVCVQWCLYSHCLQGRRDVCLCTVVSLLPLFVGQERCLFVYSGVFTLIVCRVGELFVCVQWCLYSHCLQGRRDVCLCTVVSLLSLFVGQERCLFVYSGVFTLIVCRVGEMFVCVQWCLYRHCLQGRRDVCLCTVVSLLSLFVGQERCLFVYSGVFTAIVCRVGEMFVCVQWCLYSHCLQGRRDVCLCTVVSLLSLFAGQERCLFVYSGVFTLIVCRVGGMIVCVQWCLYSHCLQGRRDVCLCTVASLPPLFVGQERCLFVYSGVFTAIVCRVGEMFVCVQWCLYSHCLQGRRDVCLCTVVSLLSLFVGQERCLFVYSGVFTAIVCRVGEMFVCVQWCLYSHCLQGRRDVCLCTVVSLLSLFVGQERCLFVYSGVFTAIVCRVGEMFVCIQWCFYSHCLQGRRDVCLCTVVSLLSLFVGQER